MKKTLILSAVMLSMAMSGTAFAETDVSITASTSIKTTIGNRFDSIKEKVEARKAQWRDEKPEGEERKAIRASTTADHRAEIKAKLSLAKQEKVESHLEKIEVRLTSAFDRIAHHIDRVEVQIEKHADKLSNKADIEAKLAEADVAIETGRDNLAELKAQAEITIVSDQPRAAFGEAKASFRAVMQDLRTAHGKVIEAIRLIKANPSVSVKATTTTEVEAE